jgi:hypothetical protein
VRVFTSEEQEVAGTRAINGAFSVAGSALTAVTGLTVGSPGLGMLAVSCYAVARAAVPWQYRPAAANSERVANPVARTA